MKFLFYSCGIYHIVRITLIIKVGKYWEEGRWKMEEGRGRDEIKV